MDRGHSTSPTTSWSGQRRSFPTAVAQRILRRDKTCQGCGATAGLQADHIINHAEATLMGWAQDQIDSEANGQALCGPCHEVKSRGEQRRGVARFNARRARPRGQHPGLVA